MEDVIEYNFSTSPEWIAEAIEFTDSGLELNFKKLSAICGQCKLPNRICVVLESSTLDIDNGLYTRENKPELDQSLTRNSLPNGESFDREERKPESKSESTLDATAERTLDSAPENGVDNTPQAITTEPEIPVQTNGNFLGVPTEETKPRRPVRRTESVIEREIRLQREKEDGVKLERERALRHLRRKKLLRETKVDDSLDLSEQSCSSVGDEDQSTQTIKHRAQATGNSVKTASSAAASSTSSTEITAVVKNTQDNKSSHNKQASKPVTDISTSSRERAKHTSTDLSAPTLKGAKHNEKKHQASDQNSTSIEKVDQGIIEKKSHQKEPENTPSRRQILRNKINKGVTFSAKDIDNDSKKSAATKLGKSREKTTSKINTREEIIPNKDADKQTSKGSQVYVDGSMQRIEQEIRSLRLREEELRRLGVKT